MLKIGNEIRRLRPENDILSHSANNFTCVYLGLTYLFLFLSSPFSVTREPSTWIDTEKGHTKNIKKSTIMFIITKHRKYIFLQFFKH